MIRVAHVLVSSDLDGIGTHVLTLANEQARSGQVVPMLVTSPSARYRDSLTDAEFSVLTLPASARSHPRRTLTQAGALARHADLVHVHGYRATRLIPSLRRSQAALWNRPLVATCHGFVPADLRRRLRMWQDVHGLRHADAVIAVSPALAAQLRSTLPKTTPVADIPNGVPVQQGARTRAARRVVRLSLGVRADCTVVAFAGRLVPEKRPDLVIDVARQVLALRDDVHFVVLGDGPERGRLEALARRENLLDRVTFVGLLPSADTWISGVSMLLHPSDYEATPRAVLEAMAAGVPVAATDVGGVAHLLGYPCGPGSVPAGLLSRRGDLPSLVTNTLTLIQDPVLRSGLGRAGRDRVSTLFTIERMEQKVRQVYAEVLNRSVHQGLAHDRYA